MLWLNTDALQNSLPYIVPAVITVFVTPILIFLRKKIMYAINAGRSTIIIKEPKQIIQDGARVKLLKVRENKKEVINKVYNFKKISNNEIAVRVPFDRKYGFRFKCFIDLPDSSDDTFKRAEEELQKLGMKHISKGVQPNRIWFIIPDYPSSKSKAGFLNNDYLPY